MTHVVVPARWLESGQMGPLCARHGVPTDRLIQRTFATATPSWVYLLLVTGILIPAILQAVLRKTVRGSIPGCPQCVADRRRSLALGWGMFAVVALLLVLSMSLSSVVLLALTLLGLVAWLLSIVVFQGRRVAGTLSKDQQSVTLKGVDQRFADAARAALLVPVPPPASGTFLRQF